MMLQPLMRFGSCHARGCHNPIAPFALSPFYFTEMHPPANTLLNNSALVCRQPIGNLSGAAPVHRAKLQLMQTADMFFRSLSNEKFLFAYVILFNLKTATDLMLKIIRNKGLKIYGVNSSLTMPPQPNIPNSIPVITMSYCVV